MCDKQNVQPFSVWLVIKPNQKCFVNKLNDCRRERERALGFHVVCRIQNRIGCVKNDNDWKNLHEVEHTVAIKVSSSLCLI